MQKPRLGKIKLLSAKEQVAAVLRKAILSRDLVEGQEITLEGIATMVGVSSMPVREAFQILAADGLIKVRPNKELTNKRSASIMRFARCWRVKQSLKRVVPGRTFRALPKCITLRKKRWRKITQLNIQT